MHIKSYKGRRNIILDSLVQVSFAFGTYLRLSIGRPAGDRDLYLQVLGLSEVGAQT